MNARFEDADIATEGFERPLLALRDDSNRLVDERDGDAGEDDGDD